MASVSKLGPNDLAAFRDLQRVFAEAFEDHASYLGRPPSDDYVRRWLGSDGGIVLVASVDGAIVGGLVAYVLEKLEQERSEIYIYDLAVAAHVRRRGIATALIRELEREGRARGAYVIFVQADHGDDPAIALYTSLGRREDVLHFDIAIGASP